MFSVIDHTTQTEPYACWLKSYGHRSNPCCEGKIIFKLHAVISFSRSPLSPRSLLCWPLWGCLWNLAGCHCVLDTEWWRQCWFLPHEHCYQWSPTPIWRTSENQQCQCYTVQTDRVLDSLWVQHHSTWRQLWESEEWAPNNHSWRYTANIIWCICVL